ncbi:MAG: glycerol-3-phosphate 1-O-acyltransferase [Sphaerobacteraceae bacterium]|nr:MAG: glycerol-3-phosphate 1-O-acyltransferase [Sphaerobacteraceae bacterium]
MESNLDTALLFIVAGLALGAYLLGSIPSGLIIGKIVSGTDVREHGSGNTGMVNVFRAAGPLAGGLTFVMDGLKGFFPVFIAMLIDVPIWAVFLVAAATIIGHDWSIILRGKGGKGIATSVGVMAAFSPIIAVIAIALWIGLIVSFRYASLASLLMIGSFPVMLLVAGFELSYVLFGIGLWFVAIFQHRENLLRLRDGTEAKLSLGSNRTSVRPSE